MTAKARILVVGSGGREHALAEALSRHGTASVEVCPGNPGIARDFPCVPAGSDLAAVCAERRPDLVVVGPEQPLVDGLADELHRRGIPVVGPEAAAARLEGSKAFMKELCSAAAVPTAVYDVFTDAGAAAAWLEGRPGGWVVKADGLAAGKGVTVCDTAAEAAAEARRFLEGAFGDASARVIIEQRLPGREVSVLGLCDGERALLFAPARDHKPLLDGDRGPNTGGMGAVAPLGERDGVSAAFLDRVQREVFAPVLAELRRRGTPYRGILYAGLMIEGDELWVLEFNVRFGDPEAEAVLFGTDTDLVPLFLTVGRGDRLPDDAPDLVAGCQPSCTVVVASEGYPEKPIKGRRIELPREVPDDAKVFFAGVAEDDGQLVTSGGRVLAVSARGPDLPTAIDRAYTLVDQIHFEGCHVRRDIGHSVR